MCLFRGEIEWMKNFIEKMGRKIFLECVWLGGKEGNKLWDPSILSPDLPKSSLQNKEKIEGRNWTSFLNENVHLQLHMGFTQVAFLRTFFFLAVACLPPPAPFFFFFSFRRCLPFLFFGQACLVLFYFILFFFAFFCVFFFWFRMWIFFLWARFFFFNKFKWLIFFFWLFITFFCFNWT